MYKNFKITEEEKKQILESHMSHGYKKPLNEQSDDDSTQYTDQETLDSKLEKFAISVEGGISDLMEEAFQESSNKMDMSVSDDMANKIISLLDEIKNNVRMEHLEKEPSDDDIYNQPGSEGGVSYKGDDDNFQGR
jgi:hypothetical protein